MGIVASMASVPVTVEIFKGELQREKQKLDDIKYGHYQHGDADLDLIKRLSHVDINHQNDVNDGLSKPAAYSTPGHHRLEKVYLTGVYKEKYKYMTQKNGNSEQNSKPRKAKSAYPAVRL